MMSRPESVNLVERVWGCRFRAGTPVYKVNPTGGTLVLAVVVILCAEFSCGLVQSGDPRCSTRYVGTNLVTQANILTGNYSPIFLRLALGLVYFHFGVLKFFPDLSPAEMIATQTVMTASGHRLDAQSAQFVLATLETAIGIGFILNVFPRFTFLLFLLHMVGTFLPLFLLPEFTFKIAPLAPNIEGQYILKNIVFVAAGWTVLLPQIVSKKSRATAAGETDVPSQSTEGEPHVADRHETLV